MIYNKKAVFMYLIFYNLYINPDKVLLNWQVPILIDTSSAYFCTFARFY